ncbi:DNA/RNA nuclease SfsA [Evansella sp. AB-rgal1]|uniref:DNA/RNA nuclease SfsA n=1 Tax=Evansella sp. AB-rgal1 TaxID=3242696 RepID=UPI00359D7867
MNERSIPFPSDLIKANFVERPNRFIVRCKLDNKDIVVDAHMADPGRLKELLIPGKPLYVKENDDPKRKTKYSVVIVEREDASGWVSVNSMMPNKLAIIAVREQVIQTFKGWNYVRSEYPKGESRWDLLLQKNSGRKMVVEVKGVSLLLNGIGQFPDAVTKRGAKHVLELGQIAKEDGWETSLLFVTQREDITKIKPAVHIDPKFAQALREAKSAGVNILACRCSVTIEGMQVLEEIPVEVE